MYHVYLRGAHVATFEAREHVIGYVRKMHFPFEVKDEAGKVIHLFGPKRVKEIMAEQGVTQAQAQVILNRELLTGAPAGYRGPGRPPSDVKTRVAAIMAERKCAYGTAYAQYRRELDGRTARKPGRPPKLRLMFERQKAADTLAEMIQTTPEARQPEPSDPVAAALKKLSDVRKTEYESYEVKRDALNAAAAEVKRVRELYGVKEVGDGSAVNVG